MRAISAIMREIDQVKKAPVPQVLRDKMLAALAKELEQTMEEKTRQSELPLKGNK